jgi:DNA-binding NarL/FixJ family response regulator
MAESTLVPTTNIRLLVVSERSLTVLGLRGALVGCPGIEIVGECDNIDGVADVVQQISPDLVLIDLQDESRRRQVFMQLSTDAASVGMIFLTSLGSDAEVVDVLRSVSIGFCCNAFTPEKLVSTIHSVHQGYSCLDKDISTRLAELLRNTDVIRRSSYAGKKGEWDTLTERETEVLRLIACGLTNSQIAKRLIVSHGTAKAHVRSILFKMGVPDRTTAAVEAVRRGLVAS